MLAVCATGGAGGFVTFKSNQMTSVESYMHKAAKDVFASWLRDLAAEAGLDNYVTWGDIVWRVNRPAPHYGVWLEYPFGRSSTGVWGDIENPNRAGLSCVWDEIDDKWNARPPSFDELVSSGSPPEFIADIAIQHKGCITTVFEIVHKHDLSLHKALAYAAFNLEFWVIPAAWVLHQVKRPDTIPLTFRVEPWNGIQA